MPREEGEESEKNKYKYSTSNNEVAGQKEKCHTANACQKENISFYRNGCECARNEIAKKRAQEETEMKGVGGRATTVRGRSK